jgi:hypothetical protein
MALHSWRCIALGLVARTFLALHRTHELTDQMDICSTLLATVLSRISTAHTIPPQGSLIECVTSLASKWKIQVASRSCFHFAYALYRCTPLSACKSMALPQRTRYSSTFKGSRLKQESDLIIRATSGFLHARHQHCPQRSVRP